MQTFFRRQLNLHVILLMFIVLLATLPSWFANTYVLSEEIKLDDNLKGAKIPLKTDDEVVQREEEAISIDGLSVAEKKLLKGEGEAHHFQAEVSRLMHLIINSLYSNKEIFLRELISNASDALDKIRFYSLTDESALSTKPELEIRLKPDPLTRTLRVIDTGVGMTKAELVANLGTIAKSGTSEFLKNFETPSASDLIGQFGVGFYSAFLVADRVTVTSKNNNDSQHVWTSDASSFSVVEDPEGNTLGRGTEILLHIREDSAEYLDQEVLKELVLKYSSFINFPIYLWTSRIERHEVVIEKEQEEEPEEVDGIVIEEDEEEEDEEEETEIIEETVYEWVQLNNVQPIWLRDPKDVTEEEYLAFYRSIEENNDPEDPYTWVHFTAEGDLDFKAILYVPQEVPSGLFDAKRMKGTRSVKLYVKRVFITDDFDVILPKYLHFVKGVVDSSSLPLNVSREILQQDKSLKQMEKKLIRKIISMVQKLAQDDEEKYRDFYHDYRVNLKLGLIEDQSNQERLMKLLRFPSSKDPATKTSFDQYIENALPNQNSIYYLAGEDVASCQQSPLLEKLIEKGYEVLYFIDPIDEYWTQSINSYEGKRLINIAKENNLNLDLEEDEDPKTLKEEFETLTTFLKSHLGSKVQKVTLSTRLSSTPSAIVASNMGYSANLERILKAQTLGQELDQFQRAKKVLEINPKHPIIIELNERVKVSPDDQQNKDTADLLFDTAVLHSGFSLDDPSSFAKRIHRIIERGLGVEKSTNDAAEAENVESSE